MSERRLCKNCGDEYKVHIDYTFTEWIEGDFVEALEKALPNVTCKNYKPMTNLEYLEHVAYNGQILNKPCIICGRRNIEHMVFYNPYMKWHQRHMVREGTTDDCVPGSDHYACIDNLDYLERLSEAEERSL